MPKFPGFIVDECTGTIVVKWLASLGYEIISVFDSFRGNKDVDILAMAKKNSFIIITNYKDFGEMVFKD